MVRCVLITAVFLSSLLCGQDLHVSGKRIRAHVQYLSSNEMQGRGVGTAGEKLATGYIASQLQAEGVTAAGDGQSYFQKVPFIGSKLLPSATLGIEGPAGTTKLTLQKEYA